MIARGLNLRCEVVTEPAFRHERLDAILRWPQAIAFLAIHEVGQEQKGLLFIDGVFERLLEPGRHVFWKTSRKLRVEAIELREEILDVSGQEIMTADRVTLRLNVLVTYRVVEPILRLYGAEEVGLAGVHDAELSQIEEQ